MTLGQRVKQLRKAKGWNQTELGEKIELSCGGVAGIEVDRVDPSKKVILKLSEIFEVSTDYLLKGIETEQTITETEQEIIQAVREDNALLNALKEAIELKKKVMSQIKCLSHRGLEEQQLEHT